ncbi:hypothetical protein F5880DRAFT_854986 [Lentinula raphanica]|nr:hypothetical protein F5880DRAFT_854986 [Lentinula raphanica]
MALSLLLPIVLQRWTVTQEAIVLEGYQMYAVDNWVLDRQQVPTLVVHTGDPAHKIIVSALSPPSQTDWDTALACLRRHANAKPKETPYGTVLVTSLAQFRSDFTIVQIPDGNLESVRSQLYTNINLLRMGCSGRSGLTLEEPSDATKDRFTSTYFLPDNHLSGGGKTPSMFNDTVLELVKLVQVSLHIFGYYKPSSFDGLLCDFTVEALRLWVKEIGEQLVEGLDSMERTADPSTVASLLSLVLAVRNRLVGLSGSTNVIPKDPFLHPRLFTRALATYITANNATPHNSLYSFSPTQIMSSASSGGSRTSHSPRQSISQSGHGGSPHAPASSIPAFLKDQFSNLAHGNSPSVDSSHSQGFASSNNLSTPNPFITSPSNSITSPPPLTSISSSSRLPGGIPFSSEPMGGKLTPTLSLTVPSPTNGVSSPLMSLSDHSYSALNGSPVVEHAGSFSRAFPPTLAERESPSRDRSSSDGVFLNRSVIEYVFSAYDNKLLKTSPELRRAVRKEQKANKEKKKDSVSYMPDDDGTGKDGLSSLAGLSNVAPHAHILSGSSLPLTSSFKSGLTGTLASTLTGGNAPSGAASILMPVSDLEEFIELIIGEISYRRTREEKREKKERKEREKGKVKEEKEERKERERREADKLSSSSSSDGIDFTKAARKVKAKVKGRSADKLRDSRGEERDIMEVKGSIKENKKHKDKDNIGGVGGLVLGLWTGRVNLVVKLREKTEEREREREKRMHVADSRHALATERDGALSDGFSSWRSHPSNPSTDSKHRPSLWSDGDTDANDSTQAGKRITLPAGGVNSPAFTRRSSVSAVQSRSRYGSVQSVTTTDKPDERSTEEEGPGILGSETLGALWAKSGSKVKGKLESWAGWDFRIL